MRNILMTLAAFAVIVLVGAQARADTITFNGGFGTSATVSNYTLVGNTFTFTLTNTSSSGNITAVGFDLAGDRLNNFQIVGPSNGFAIAQDVDVQAGAVTSAGVNQGVFDLALLTGGSFGDGAGTDGLAPGQSATFTITGDFTGSAQQIAESLSVRVKGVGPNDESTVAEPTTVPEPMTMFLFGTGLVGLAGFARRRRKSRLS
jgi:hypothetical protein